MPKLLVGKSANMQSITNVNFILSAFVDSSQRYHCQFSQQIEHFNKSKEKNLSFFFSNRINLQIIMAEAVVKQNKMKKKEL